MGLSKWVINACAEGPVEIYFDTKMSVSKFGMLAKSFSKMPQTISELLEKSLLFIVTVCWTSLVPFLNIMKQVSLKESLIAFLEMPQGNVKQTWTYLFLQ